MLVLVSGFAVTAYKGARGLRGAAPKSFTWISKRSLRGSRLPTDHGDSWPGQLTDNPTSQEAHPGWHALTRAGDCRRRDESEQCFPTGSDAQVPRYFGRTQMSLLRTIVVKNRIEPGPERFLLATVLSN